MENQEERRKDKRIKDSVIVFFETADHKISEQELECLNLSYGGMQVISDFKLELGQVLKCDLGVITDVIPLELQAKVANIREHGKGNDKKYVMGLSFIISDDLTQGRLKDYIKRKMLMDGE